MCLCQDDAVGPVSWRGDCHCLPTHWPHSLQCTMTGRHTEVENHSYTQVRCMQVESKLINNTQDNSYSKENTFFQRKKLPWVGHEPTTLCSLGRVLYCLSPRAATLLKVFYTTDIENNVTLTTWMIGAPSVIPSMMTSFLYL